MNNKTLIIFTLAILIIASVVFYFMSNQEKSDLALIPQNIYMEDSSKKVIHRIPQIEYEVPGNKLTDPIIVGYKDVPIAEGDVFIIESESLGNLFGSSVGNIKVKVVNIGVDSVTINILADERFDGKFYPRDPVDTLVGKNETCVSAYPLVMDVSYSYCFTVEKLDSDIALKYTIKSRSTMPTPN